MFFFHFKGSHVLLKLLLGLKSSGWCVLGCWLTIYSVQTLFFSAMAEWQWQNEWHFCGYIPLQASPIPW
jgi:hypothetical protein